MSSLSIKKKLRYALVLWVNENKTSILDASFVKDKSLFEDPERVGIVEHGTKDNKAPTEGWKSYPARVLAVNSDPNKLREQEVIWATQNQTGLDVDQGKQTDLDVDTGNKGKKRKGHGDKETASPKDKKKKTETAKRMAEVNILNVLGNENTPVDTELQRAHKRIKELELLNFQLQKGIPQMIEAAISKALKQQPQHPEIHTPRLEVIETPEFIAPKEPTPAALAANEVKMTHLEDVVKPDILLEATRAGDFKKVTRNLMVALFEREEMASSCVKTSKHNDREALDREKVSMLIGYVTSRFTCTAVEVRSVMAQKLKDERNFQNKVKAGN